MLDTIKKFANTAVDAIATLVAGVNGTIRKILMMEKVQKFLSILVVAYRIAVDALYILVTGFVGTAALIFIFTSSFVIVPLYTSIVLMVLFIFYESRRRWLLRHWDANHCDKDCGGVCKHLEQANEQTHNANGDNLDSVIALIRNKMKRHVYDLGCVNLNEYFNHYQELLGVLIKLNRQIKNSLQNRDQRDELYRKIVDGADFKDLLKYFDELRGSKTAIRESIAKKEAESRDLRMQWWIGVALTVSSIVATVLILQNASGT